MEAVAVQVSFRLGGADGVAVEAKKWEWALGELGFRIRRVAGELDDGLRPEDAWLPFLAIDPVDGTLPDPDALGAAIAGAHLVIVENLCSLPLNPDASTSTAEVLAAHEGAVVFHHHDLPWQRPGLFTPDGIPPQRENSLHVTINDYSRAQLENRGFAAVTLRNAFDLDPPRGDRIATRAKFGFAPDDVVLVQPTRAIPRKNVPGAIAFANALARLEPDRRIRLWITGPTEDGFDDMFRRALAEATMPVTVGRAESAADAYAACDLVLFPSTWEGFGNPIIESIAHRRPIAVGSYPVLDEIRTFGVEMLSVDDPEGVRDWLRAPRPDVLERNVERVSPYCSLADLPQRLEAAFTAGMDPVVDPATDPIDARRARIATWVSLAKRVGYGLLALAMIAFIIAAATDFPAGLLTVTVVALVGACVVLPVPIVLGYGLRAAERDEREERARRAGEESPGT